MQIRPEFSAIAMNDHAVDKCRAIREAFSAALESVSLQVGPSRELSIVTTKMQEACMWAIRGVAQKAENLRQPTSECTEAALNAPIGAQRHG
jgi:hypothetical protein